MSFHTEITRQNDTKLCVHMWSTMRSIGGGGGGTKDYPQPLTLSLIDNHLNSCAKLILILLIKTTSRVKT